MSLATYTDLQTQVANWLARVDLNAYIPDMITLCEAAACRRLKVRPMESLTTLTPSGGVAALPTDYLGYRRLTWTGSNRVDLTYVPPSLLQYYYPSQPSGTPSIFTIEASNITVMPTDDSSLEFLYFQRTPAVSGTLNWLYATYPDAYLFGTLAEANFFNRGSALQNAGMWKQRRDEVFDEIQNADFHERQGMSMRVMGPTP